MILAILHLAFDTPEGRERKAAFEAAGMGLYHIHPTQAAASAAREFPPDVVVVEVGSRPGDAWRAVREVLGVPRRRADRWPLVMVEVRAADRPDALALAPHARLLGPGAAPAEVLAACHDAVAAERERWDGGMTGAIPR